MKGFVVRVSAGCSSGERTAMNQLQEDIVLSFLLPASYVTLHEPIFIDFSIRNELAEGIEVDLGHNRKSNFDFTITEPDGSITRAPRLSAEGVGRIGRVSLEPKSVYVQRLILNEWYHFTKRGSYKIEGRLSGPIMTQSGLSVKPNRSEPLSLQIQPRNPDRLRQICQTLLRLAVESSDGQKAAESAIALSHIRDPAAVPYLEKGIRKGRLVWQYAIPGLGRIANKETIEILLSISKGQDPELSALARFVLYEIREKIQNLKMKERIKRELRI